MAFPIYSTYPVDHGSDFSWLPFPPNPSTNEARIAFASVQVEPNLGNGATRDYGFNGLESKTANQTRRKKKQETNLEDDRSETTTKPPKRNNASTGALKGQQMPTKETAEGDEDQKQRKMDIGRYFESKA
ncbi:hypothetical protein GB937_005814 [Aspergillus fischeri]|nr:hypothetical protein GB937_005814 [Aspergillus fischeri]